MSEWLHNLPILLMTLVIFGFTYLVAAAIYFLVKRLAVGERARSFKAVSPGMLPPLGILFGLLVAFIAAQVWGDTDRANAAVDKEASALRSIVILASHLPGEDARVRNLIRSYIEEATAREWPMMAHQTATLRFAPHQLTQVLQLALSMQPSGPGQQVAQRELATAVENALDARRARVIVSRSEVNGVKWACLLVQAICTLIAIAVVHSGDRLASVITLGMFSTGAAACVLLIAAHDRPFTGYISVDAGPLLQVLPEAIAAPP